MKKKLLYLSQCFPLPLDGGGKIKTFNSIKTLSKAFNVYAIFISERNATKKDMVIFQKLGIKIKIFKASTMAENIKNNYFKLVWNYIQLRPHFVYQYRYVPAFKFIKEVIKCWQPDIIHVDHINSSQFLPNTMWLKMNLKKAPVLILENHNLDHLIFKTRFYETKKLIRKLYLFIEGSLNYFYGLRNYKRYDHIFCISDEERQYLKKIYKSVWTQPLVYPIKRGVQKSTFLKKYDILFVGHLQWPPNELAVMWFIDKIRPLINLKLPNAKFHIIGKENPNLNLYKNCKNVVFHGYQKSIDKYLNLAKIFVLPFKTGGGVRIKSLTALQYGLPIVSTKLGIEGLKIKDGNEFLLADDEQNFAKCVVRLLSNQKLREEISKKQLIYFNANHSLNKNRLYLKKYLELYSTTLRIL